jgi:rRNA-processing protein FCF1
LLHTLCFVVPEEKPDLSDSSKRARDQHTEVLEMFERKKRARSMAVPTDDKKVRERLRELGEPVCLFAEDVSFICFIWPFCPFRVQLRENDEIEY